MKHKKKPLLMAHLVAGYPDDAGSLEIARGLAEGGASMLELQFPSSDPAADGPVIQEACRISLQGGFRMDHGFALAGRIAEACPVPLYIMAYGSQIYARGINRFVEECAAAGASGIIAPDLTPGNDEGLYQACSQSGLVAIPVIPAGTPEKRIREIITKAGKPEWIYCALRKGITGAKTDLDQSGVDLVQRIRSDGIKTLAGFGISSPEQVELLKNESDGVVVGSHFVKAAAAIEITSSLKDALCRTTKTLLGTVP